MMRKIQIAALALTALSMALASGASATVAHGDLTGTSFTFTNMSDTTTSAGDIEPLWGPPSVSGDNLFFTPPSFISTASGGAADQTASTFDVTVTSIDKTTIGINKLMLGEIGDYLLSGTGGVLTVGSVLASADFVVSEVNVGGVLTSANLLLNATDSFSVNTPVAGGTWSLSLNADIQALVTAQFGVGAFATVVGVNWDNDLQTASELTSTALIQKKIGAPAVTMTVVVPEPGTALLFGFGLVGLPVRRH